MQQTNGSDCDVFAAVFLFEWATTSVKANLDVRYDVSKMCTHLMDCLVRHEVLSFPTVRPRRGGNKPARKVDCITI